MRPWAPTAFPWMISFDVREAKVRRRLERLLSGLGFLSTQYSLRVAMLTPGELRRLKEGLRALEGEGVHVLLLPLGKERGRGLTWGKPLGMLQLPWQAMPDHPPVLHVGYPA